MFERVIMKSIVDLIEYLKKYNSITAPINIPLEQAFRGLMNVTTPIDLSDEYYDFQDQILLEMLLKKGITNIEDLPLIDAKIGIWLGDITTIKADAIVTAGSEKLLGCFTPLHNCVDNIVHSAAGLQVRRDLLSIMKTQDFHEDAGKAKITKGYNLPSKYIIHTVGPLINLKPTKKDEDTLRNCYLSCLKLAHKENLNNLVFCTISTGSFRFPIAGACEIALDTTTKFLRSNPRTSIKRVIFCTETDNEYIVYSQYLSKYSKNSN